MMMYMHGSVVAACNAATPAAIASTRNSLLHMCTPGLLELHGQAGVPPLPPVAAMLVTPPPLPAPAPAPAPAFAAWLPPPLGRRMLPPAARCCGDDISSTSTAGRGLGGWWAPAAALVGGASTTGGGGRAVGMPRARRTACPDFQMRSCMPCTLAHTATQPHTHTHTQPFCCQRQSEAGHPCGKAMRVVRARTSR